MVLPNTATIFAVILFDETDARTRIAIVMVAINVVTLSNRPCVQPADNI